MKGAVQFKEHREMVRMGASQVMNIYFKIYLPLFNVGKTLVKPFLDKMSHLPFIYLGKPRSMKTQVHHPVRIEAFFEHLYMFGI